jgi:deazaflavin-dependent oxidoreductase (nitroreductase family)
VEVRDYVAAGPYRRLIRRIGWSRPGTWLNTRTLHHLDRLTRRLTGRRITSSAVLAGLPVVMLSTTGAQSGRPRTVPLLGLPHGPNCAVIASNFGQAHHPGWYHNLRANPRALLEVDGEPREVIAEEVTGAERDEIWQRGLRLYPGWARYERRAGNRRIAVFILRPNS